MKNALWICGLLLLMIGCSQEASTPIIEKVEQGGCGALKGVTTDAIQQCLAARRQLAVEVDAMCKTVREKAPAQWHDSTEGRVCTAARNLAFFRSAPVQGDGKTYDPTK